MSQKSNNTRKKKERKKKNKTGQCFPLATCSSASVSRGHCSHESARTYKGCGISPNKQPPDLKSLIVSQ